MIVVDATKDLLLKVLNYHPFLVKPNNHELGEIFGVSFRNREEVIPYGKKLQEMGAQNVLISMAGKGAVLTVHKRQVFFARIGDAVSHNDCFIAIFDAAGKGEILAGSFDGIVFYFKGGKIFRFISAQLCPAGLERKICVDNVRSVVEFDFHSSTGHNAAFDYQRFDHFGSDIRQFSCREHCSGNGCTKSKNFLFHIKTFKMMFLLIKGCPSKRWQLPSFCRWLGYWQFLRCCPKQENSPHWGGWG